MTNAINGYDMFFCILGYIPFLPLSIRQLKHIGKTDSSHVSGHISWLSTMTPRFDTVSVNLTIAECNCSSVISTFSSWCRSNPYNLSLASVRLKLVAAYPQFYSSNTYCKLLNCRCCISSWHTNVSLSVISVAVSYQTAFRNRVELYVTKFSEIFYAWKRSWIPWKLNMATR
jgi:hypothetical protein